MQVFRDRASIAAIADSGLRALIEQRVKSLEEYDDYELHELVTFIVVEPGDLLSTIDEQLGLPVLGNRHEFIEEHRGWYEAVYVTSDDGAGIEVFIPKAAGVDPELLAMCASEATPAQEKTDT